MWVWPPLGFFCGLAVGMFALTIGDWAFVAEDKRALTLAGGLIVIVALFALRAGNWAFVEDEDHSAWVAAVLIGVTTGVCLRLTVGWA